MELAKMFVLAAFFIIQVHAIDVKVTIYGCNTSNADKDTITVKGTKETSESGIVVTVNIANMVSKEGWPINNGQGLKDWMVLYPTYHLLAEDAVQTPSSLQTTLGLDIPKLADDADELKLSNSEGYQR